MVVSWSRREGRKKKSIHSPKRRGRARRERASYYRKREREREREREGERDVTVTFSFEIFRPTVPPTERGVVEYNAQSA